MAYAILRHNDVEVGKRDFLCPINFLENWQAGRTSVDLR
jgi:hypothetical protein